MGLSVRFGPFAPPLGGRRSPGGRRADASQAKAEAKAEAAKAEAAALPSDERPENSAAQEGWGVCVWELKLLFFSQKVVVFLYTLLGGFPCCSWFGVFFWVLERFLVGV